MALGALRAARPHAEMRFTAAHTFAADADRLPMPNTRSHIHLLNRAAQLHL